MVSPTRLHAAPSSFPSLPLVCITNHPGIMQVVIRVLKDVPIPTLWNMDTTVSLSEWGQGNGLPPKVCLTPPVLTSILQFRQEGLSQLQNRRLPYNYTGAKSRSVLSTLSELDTRNGFPPFLVEQVNSHGGKDNLFHFTFLSC